MTVSSGNIERIPKSIVSGGSVRFLPNFVSSVKGMYGASSFLWSFGDGATSAVWNPIHTYPTVTGASPYDVSVVVKDAAGGAGYTITVTNAIMQDADSNVPAPQTDGSFLSVSVYLYNDSGSMMVNRARWSGCHLSLLYPKVVSSIDKIGTATFSLLDIGDATATERGLIIASKVNVLIFQGNAIVFSGIVRRATQNIQNGFGTTNRVKLWDFECDSDLARLRLKSSIKNSLGVITDTPGNIARTILAPTPYEWDCRGEINCTDSVVTYKLNSSSSPDDPGSRYDNLMNLWAATNYDLASRPDYLIHEFTTFDGATAFTFTGVAWTADELKNCNVAVIGNSGTGVTTYGTVSSNTATVIYSSVVGASNSPTSAGFLIIHRGFKIDFANDLSQPSVVRNFDVNKDVYEYSDNDDERKLITKVVSRGKDIYGDSISVKLAAVNAYDNDRQMFNNCTTTKGKTDGVIYRNGWRDTPSGIDYGQPLDANEFWLLGGGYTIQVGDPFFLQMDRGGVISSGAVIDSVDGETSVGGDTTVSKFHLVSPFDRDHAGTGSILAYRTYVDDASVANGATFASPINFMLGEEPTAATGVGHSSVYGNYIYFYRQGSSSTQKTYCHGTGCLVAKKTQTAKLPTESTPEQYSAVADYGIIVSDLVVDSNVEYSTLDNYATTLLLGFGNFYKKATCWGTVLNMYVKRVGEYYKGQQASVSTPVRVADRISVTEYDGATPEEFQIVSVTHDYDRGTVLLELGDFEKNPYTSLEQKTNAVNRTLT